VARSNRGSRVRNRLSVASFATPALRLATVARGLEALTLKRDRSIHLQWHQKISRTRHGYEAERARPWDM